MDVEIALDPGLGIAPDAFTNAWNAEEACRKLGAAETRKTAGTQFEAVTLTAVLIGIASGVAVNVLSHLIIKALEKEKPGQQVEVQEITRPDGSRMLVVKASTG